MKCGHLSVTSRNIQWIWLALDADTREIVGVLIGDRSGQSAKQLWQSLVRVEGNIAVPPLPSETVLAPFGAHGYSMCFAFVIGLQN